MARDKDRYFGIRLSNIPYINLCLEFNALLALFREDRFCLRRWERGFISGIAGDVGFTSEWYDPFISAAGLKEYGASFFENYLANPQSKLLRLSKGV